jgi:hypothetical protein
MGVSPEMLEKARLTMSRVTPMTEILNLCVGYVDESNIDAVTQQLTHLLRHGVCPVQHERVHAIAHH